MRKKKSDGPLQKWGKKINWARRVKAVCKPCWEIKYCPYGPLVEDFPLKAEPDEKSCRIFGHDCPVFYVAEPLTETRELRNIGRSIPRVTQFRVLKRENQICSNCGKAVKDEDIEFDHIIPWSKGGASDEHNIRLLCKACNRKKGNRFEDRHLVQDVRDHLTEPMGIDFLEFLLMAADFSQAYYEENNHYPTPKQFANNLANGKVTIVEEKAAEIMTDLDNFFSGNRPQEIKQKVFKALSYRWGFYDRAIHKLGESAELHSVDVDELFRAELSLINRLGWRIRLEPRAEQKWKSK